MEDILLNWLDVYPNNIVRIDDGIKCGIKECMYKYIFRDKKYCQKHQCIITDCINFKKNDSRYCISHECKDLYCIEFCNSEYCQKHMCIINGCINVKNNGFAHTICL